MKKLVFALLSVLVLSNFCTANAAIGTLPEHTAVFDKDFTSMVKSGETDYDIDSHGWSTSADAWSDWSGFAVQSGAPLVLHSSGSDEFKGLTGKNPVAVYRTNTDGSFRVSGKLSSDAADSFSLWLIPALMRTIRLCSRASALCTSVRTKRWNCGIITAGKSTNSARGVSTFATSGSRHDLS